MRTMVVALISIGLLMISSYPVSAGEEEEDCITQILIDILEEISDEFILRCIEEFNVWAGAEAERTWPDECDDSDVSNLIGGFTASNCFKMTESGGASAPIGFSGKVKITNPHTMPDDILQSANLLNVIGTSCEWGYPDDSCSFSRAMYMKPASENVDEVPCVSITVDAEFYIKIPDSDLEHLVFKDQAIAEAKCT